MSLILPKSTVDALRAQERRKALAAQKPAETPAPVDGLPVTHTGGYDHTRKHALETDDFVTADQVRMQVQQFLDYKESGLGAVPSPVGWRLAVVMMTVPETSSGGVIMVNQHREARSITSPQGVVFAVGSRAYADPQRFNENEPWAKLGDRVLFQKYGGRMFQLRNEQYVCILNDTDIQAVIDSGWIQEGGDE